MYKEEVKKYLFWGILIVIILVSYFLLKDFIVAILSSFVLAYIIKPVYDRLSKVMPKKLASFITVLVSILIIISVIALTLTSLTNELIKVINEDTTSQIVDYFSSTKYSEIVKNNIALITGRLGNYLLSLVSSIALHIPGFILNIFIVFFTTFYLLVEWNALKEKIIKIIPFENGRSIIEKAEKTAREILLVTLIVAVLEAVIAMIGFWILGIKLYIILGIMIGVLALIPALGPALIWVPLAIIFFISGKYTMVLGIVILGLILSLGIDYLLRIKILGKKTKMHPVIMLFGLLGGIKLFGIMGFVIGPLILSILVTIIENIPTKK
ncbi:AI-2E family transporter [Candidatus Pacearchaeota archaeon]|nr:AI-2E family transporter [Candidatus Pacearchaeota archaeon]